MGFVFLRGDVNFLFGIVSISGLGFSYLELVISLSFFKPPVFSFIRDVYFVQGRGWLMHGKDGISVFSIWYVPLQLLPQVYLLAMVWCFQVTWSM